MRKSHKEKYTKFSFRNFVFCKDTSDKFIAESVYIHADCQNVLQEMIKFARLELRPELNDSILIGTSYLGEMTMNEFETHIESLSSDAAASYHYLMVFRSPTTTFSIIIYKDTPIITKPTIETVKKENNLEGFILVYVEDLGFFGDDPTRISEGAF